MGARVFSGDVLTDDDMRDMRSKGAPLSEIFRIAYRFRRLGRNAVREILFGATR